MTSIDFVVHTKSIDNNEVNVSHTLSLALAGLNSGESVCVNGQKKVVVCSLRPEDGLKQSVIRIKSSVFKRAE